MNSIGTPSIRVYSSGLIGGVRSPTARHLVVSDSEDEADSQKHRNQMTFRIEDDLNWASKYLSSEHSSTITPRSGRTAGASSSGDGKGTSPPAPGKYFPSTRSEDSGISGSRSSVGRRSKSPSTFSENSDDGVMRRVIRRHDDYHTGPQTFRKGNSSPATHRSSTIASNVYLGHGGKDRAYSVPPTMSRPVTRTFADLGVPILVPSIAHHATLERARPATWNFPDLATTRSGTRTQCDSDSRLATRTPVTARTSRPVSETRKKLRSLLCRTKNDPRYFDDDL